MSPSNVLGKKTLHTFRKLEALLNCKYPVYLKTTKSRSLRIFVLGGKCPDSCPSCLVGWLDYQCEGKKKNSERGCSVRLLRGGAHWRFRSSSARCGYPASSYVMTESRWMRFILWLSRSEFCGPVRIPGAYRGHTGNGAPLKKRIQICIYSSIWF